MKKVFEFLGHYKGVNWGGFPRFYRYYNTAHNGQLEEFYAGDEVVVTEEGIWRRVKEEFRRGNPHYPSYYYAEYELIE